MLRQSGTLIAFFILVLAAVFSVGDQASSGQQQQGGDFPEFSTYTLFTGDSVDVNQTELQKLADAIRRVQAPGNCPLGRLKIRVPTGDPSFQGPLLGARHDAVLNALNRIVRVEGRLFTEKEVFGDRTGHDTVFTPAIDKRPPQLKIGSTPENGSPVQELRTTIQLTIDALDDPSSWPRGLKTIQVVADSENGRVVKTENYPQPCSEPNEKRVQALYVVPANPPPGPMVKLTITAEDHAGLKTSESLMFPTDPNVRLRRYNVKLTASGDYANSCENQSYALKGSWESLVVKITDGSASWKTVTVETPELAIGSIRGTWSYQRFQIKDKCVGPCAGGGRFSFKTTVDLDARKYLTNDSGSFVGFSIYSDSLSMPDMPNCFLTPFYSSQIRKMTADNVEVQTQGWWGASFSQKGSGDILDKVLQGRAFTVMGVDAVDGHKWKVELVFTPVQ